MKVQATMMSVAGREEITAQTARMLISHGRLGELCVPALHYAAPVGRKGPAVPSEWIVVRRELEAAGGDLKRLYAERVGGHRENPFDDFRALFESLEPGVPLLFYEDDLAVTRNACRRQLEVLSELPPDAGVVSFLDFRNEWPRPGLFAAPDDHDLWGSQALMFPGDVVTALREAVLEPTKIMGWDVWTGRAVKALGRRVYHYSPSLFQHIGQWSAWAPGSPRPAAINYPGDDFDALGPCPDPVPAGKSIAPTPVRCELHGVIHYNGGLCPIFV